MRFTPGQTIVRRDVHHDGRITAAMSTRVVADDHRGLLTWTAVGSATMWRTTMEGARIRKFTVAQLTDLPTMLTPSHWSGSDILWLTPPDAAHSIWWFFEPGGDFQGWYVNLETPSRRWSRGIDMTDLVLDIWVNPDRTWSWKDEDELAERTDHPDYFSAADAAAIRAEGEKVIKLIESAAYPFDGTFTDFKPEPDWKPTAIPAKWDVLA